MMVRVIAPAAFLVALGSMAAGAATTPGASSAGSHPAFSSGQSAAASAQAHPTRINIIAASQIIGRALQDPSGADAGAIQSLVIDTRTGVVDFVIVGSSGSFNTNGSVIAVPWLALQPPNSGNGPITTKISVDKILHSPQINPARINQLNQPGQRARIYGYYGYPYPRYYRNGYGYGNGWGAGYGWNAGLAGGHGPRPVAGNVPAAPGPVNTPANTQVTNSQSNSKTASTPQANPQQANKQQPGRSGALVVTRNAVISTLNQRRTTSANALQNATVYSRSGEDIGDIDQVMIDADRGEVAFILLSRGGFLGLNQRWYVLPVEALVPAPYQSGYRLTVNADTLMGEPALNVDRQNLPTQVNASELASLYQRFRMKPYWEQNTQAKQVSGASKTQSQSSGSQSSGGQSIGQPASK